MLSFMLPETSITSTMSFSGICISNGLGLILPFTVIGSPFIAGFGVTFQSDIVKYGLSDISALTIFIKYGETNNVINIHTVRKKTSILFFNYFSPYFN
jgi:uncharacterized protein YbbC (DUF1343 family)